MDDDAKVLDEAARLSAAGQRFALVTVVRTAGSTPRKPGAKMIVREDGSQVGTVGGGALELLLIDEARAAIASGEPRLVRRHLTRQLAMCCGGEVEAFVDPLGRRERLVLVGAGHVNQALSAVGARLGFEVWVVDELEESASAERFPDAARLVHSWEPAEWGLAFDREAYVVIATRDHAVDQSVLETLARLGATPAYLGVISSRGKIARFRNRLEAKGAPDAWLERLRGPIGIAIGAETPAEIAVSVAAELVAVRRGVPVVSMAEATRRASGASAATANAQSSGGADAPALPSATAAGAQPAEPTGGPRNARAAETAGRLAGVRAAETVASAAGVQTTDRGAEAAGVQATERAGSAAGARAAEAAGRAAGAGAAESPREGRSGV